MWPNDTPEQEFANKILAMSEKEFNDWADKATLKEVEYATNMVMVASQQLREQMECLQEEEESSIEEQIFLVGCPDAEEILSKFTLNGL
jgi:capsule polysaccharide export protein KpsE/RkpR